MLGWILAALALAPRPPGALRTDGHFQDWAGVAPLRIVALAGDCAGPDFEPTVQIAYDRKHLRFAVQVRDDRFQPGADTGDALHLRLVLPGGRRRTLTVQLNDLEPPRAARALLDGKPYPKGELAATARKDGWAVEGAVRLQDLPGALDGPLKLAVVLADADADPTTPEARCSTAALDAAGDPLLPTVELGGLSGFEADFLAERPAEPLERRHGRLSGGPDRELLLITTQDVMIASHGFLGGEAGFVYFQHGWPAGTTLQHLELGDLDGRPGQEVLLVRRSWAVPGETRVDVLELYRLHEGLLHRAFAGQIAEHAPGLPAEAWAPYRLLGKGRSPRQLQLGPTRTRGFNPGNVVALGELGFTPLPWPWDHPKGRRYRLDGPAWRPVGP